MYSGLHVVFVHTFQKLIDKTVEKYGQIDCVINNAGWRKSMLN